MQHLRSHPTFVVAAALAAMHLAAQQPVNPTPGPSPRQPAAASKPAAIQFDATTMLVPAGKVELRELVDATARFTRHNILCDDRELQQGSGGAVELQSPLSLDARGAEDSLSQFLYSRGLVLCPRDLDKGLYEV